MKRSTDRILTTHVGSLPRPPDLIPLLLAKDSGQPYDADDLARRVRDAVRSVVAQQGELGIDVVNDGEHSKSSFVAYPYTRLGGFEPTDQPIGSRVTTRDALAFPAVYEEQRAMYAARPSKRGRPASRPSLVCTGPITYVGQHDVQTDVENLRAALQGVPAAEAFMTAISPNNLALNYRNAYYRTHDEYLLALADAMREEYRAIVDAGFVLQIDDPWLATHYDRSPGASIEECRRAIATGVEAVNHALRGIPEDRVRFHTCYSVNVAPRVHDFELKHFVDLMLQIRAGAYSFEAANPRHEHEWVVWQDVKLPDDKLLIPGVVSHCVALVEHPELVAQRIVRFAGVVGRERILAANDCGFATSAAGDEPHPDVAWAKLGALTEGARLASRQLWGRA
ncbi:MAG TPA: cobalamin-independent methionine synthase II family protein [Chloroflexota bacterium]|nr:cobalamin-independent methionine synthase II family protein [Chloroflexota bacterium]